ncbi:HNH endonuclease [Sorangium sp. So ce429]
MIKIPEKALPSDLQEMLAAFQEKLDAIDAYAGRVAEADRAWANKPRERFRRIRDVLTEMCSGEDRCMYCEDSVADEIEHLRPKSLYPESTFVWENYLFACGPCNRPKNNRFGVLSARTRQFVEVARPRSLPGRSPFPLVPAEPGRMMLIDPRREDPLRFMKLDLFDPFHFQALRPESCLAYARAWYTIEVLGLNRRDTLLRARKRAYGGYTSRLQAYLAQRDGGASEERLALLIDALRRETNPTVWREMQRQHRQIPELALLFEQAPEALCW